MKAILIRFCSPLIFIAGMLTLASYAQVAGASAQGGTSVVDPTQAPGPPASQPAKNQERTSFHLEAGAFYSPFVPGSGSQNWRGGDFRLTFTGNKWIVPFGGLGRISNAYGSQFNYGVGSYVHFSRHFYVIGQMSAAQESEVQFSPHRRYDLTGFFSTPQIRGMIFSVGWTEMSPWGIGGGGRIFAFGNIYYWRKFIFSGSVNLNYAKPGNDSSVSGQFSTTYGRHRHYYVTGGMSGGGAAYMMVTGAPFLVQYQTLGAYGLLTKWFASHAGINFRYDYQYIIDNRLQRHSFRTGFFYEF